MGAAMSEAELKARITAFFERGDHLVRVKNPFLGAHAPMPSETSTREDNQRFYMATYCGHACEPCPSCCHCTSSCTYEVRR